MHIHAIATCPCHMQGNERYTCAHVFTSPEICCNITFLPCHALLKPKNKCAVPLVRFHCTPSLAQLFYAQPFWALLFAGKAD